MSGFSFPNITWNQFELYNDNRTDSFENMCWELFHIEMLKEKDVPHANPSNPGVEVEPVLEPPHEDGSTQRWVSFQAKYFTKDVSYCQIKDSLSTAVTKYAGKLDHIYLFCNLTLTTTSKSYKETEKIVSDAGMTLQPVSNNDILNLIKKNRAVAEYYFLQRRIKDINLYGRLMDRFVNQYSDHPSIKMMTPDSRLFPKGLPAIDNSIRTAKEGEREPASIREMIQESWKGTEKKHILFVGEGGIGKTVAMLTLPNEEWFRAYKIPVIYVPLQSLHNYHGELNKYIRENYRNELDGINELGNVSWTDHPNLIVLLDGFNEIPVDYKAVAENHIVEWMNKPGVQIITTSRINSFLNSRFLEYTLQPLPYETIREYLLSAGIVEKELPPQSDSLWKVINVPLMLTLFTQTDKVKERASESAVSNYLDWKKSDKAVHIVWNYLQVELYRLIHNGGSDIVLSSAAILAIAPFVCYEMANKGKFYVDQEEFKQLLCKATAFFAQDQTMLPKQIADIRDRFDELHKVKPFESCKWEEYFNILSNQSVLFRKKVYRTESREQEIVYVPAHQNFRDALAAFFVSGCLLNSSSKKEKQAFFNEALLNTDFYVKNYISEFLTDDELLTVWNFHRNTEPENGRVTWILMDIIGRKRNYDYSQLDFSGLDLTGINLHRLLSKRMDICPLPAKAELMNNTKIALKSILSEAHIQRVTSISYSPDGKHLASGSADGEIRIRDLESGTSHVLKGHKRDVTCMTYSPDGKYLASGSYDSTVRIWNLESGRSRVLKGHQISVNCLSYSPDGKYLASGSYDSTVRIWNLENRTSRVLEGHQGYVNCLSYSPDGKHLASGSSDRTVRIWNLESGTSRVLSDYGSNMTCVSYSLDGEYLASGSADGKIYILDIENGKSRVLEGHTRVVTSVSYSPDGKHLASSSSDRTVRIWNLESETSHVLLGYRSIVTCVSYSSDGKYLASVDYDSSVSIWDLESERSQVLEGHTNSVTSVSYSPDGKHLANDSPDKTVRIWDLESGTSSVLEGYTYNVTSVSYCPTGKHLATGSVDGEIRIWDVENGTNRVLEGHTNSVTGISYSPDGKHLASCSVDGIIRIWDVENGSSRTLDGNTWQVTNVMYSPDGKYLASISRGKKIQIWDLESRTSRMLDGYMDDAVNVSYSPDGKHLASGSYNYKVQIWNLESGIKRELGVASNNFLLTMRINLCKVPGDIVGGILGALIGTELLAVFDTRPVAMYLVYMLLVLSYIVTGNLIEGRRIIDTRQLIGMLVIVILTSREAIPGTIPETIPQVMYSIKLFIIFFSVTLGLFYGEYRISTLSLICTLLAMYLTMHSIMIWVIPGTILCGQIGSEWIGSIWFSNEDIVGVLYSPDGRCLTGYSNCGRVYNWDLKSETCCELKGNTDKVTCASYSPDGKRLAGGLDNNTVFIWDTATGKYVKRYRIINNVNLSGANFEQAVVPKKDRVKLRETGAKA